MRCNRRAILVSGLPAATALATAAASRVRAQPAATEYPRRPIRLIVGFPPAGAADIATRVYGERLAARLGQQVVVENRPGASGNLGGEAVARAEPDGHTLLMQTLSAGAINYALYGRRMPYRPEDLAAIGLVLLVPNVIFVTPSLPVRTLRELVAHAKARPGQLNIGSSGSGTSLHLIGELLKLEAGIDLTHVPFRGAPPMLADTIAGRIQVAVDNLPSAIGHIRDGRLRALALTNPTRSPALPDCPTTAEEGLPAVEATAWFGVQAPVSTPRAIIERLARETDAIVKEPHTRARFAAFGGMPPALTPDGGTTPAAFDAFIRSEIAKWGELVRRTGARVE
jgi:tripartite-type tricarboxylate transporter receptor subunit TctC